MTQKWRYQIQPVRHDLRISDTVTRYLSDYTGYRQDATNANYQRLTTDMSDEQTRLQNKESHYWDEFTRWSRRCPDERRKAPLVSQQFSSSSNA